MELQNVPPAPGRGETLQPSQPSQPAPGAPPLGGDPLPAGGGGAFGGMGMMLVMFLPMLLIIFLLNRSQSKKQKQLESKLKKGDRVITSGGMIGKIADISPLSRYVKLEISAGVKIEVLKTAIQGVDTGDVAPAARGEAKSDALEAKK
jgi:preprotein translocase subunit YajC